METPVARTSHRIAVLAGVAAAVAIVIMLAAHQWRAAADRAGSATNLKQIGAAMKVYHDAYKHFPADIRGADGRALLSWRVRILPFLGGYDSLFAKFRLEEPWDNPHNQALLTQMPAVYAIPGVRAGPGMTYYRGFSGKTALFDPEFPEGVDLARITDGAAGTIAVVEARQPVPWTRPETEIPFTDELREAGPLIPLLGESRNLAIQLSGEIKDPEVLKPLRAAIGGHDPEGFNVLFCDGSVRFLADSTDLVLFRAMITRDRGEVFSADAY